MELVNEFLSFLRQGFNEVNAVLGLIIAVAAIFSLGEWRRLWAVALAATVIYVVAQMIIPVVADRAELRLPQIVELPFWRNALALYLGFFVVIGALFFVKKNVLKA